MANDRRKFVLALVFVGVCVALAVTLGRGSALAGQGPGNALQCAADVV